MPLFDGRSGHGFLTEILMYVYIYIYIFIYSDRQRWYKNRRERRKNARKTGEEDKKSEKAQTGNNLGNEILNGEGGRRGRGVDTTKTRSACD